MKKLPSRARVASLIGLVAAAATITSLLLHARSTIYAQDAGPTGDQLRAAVANAPAGRFARPASWDAATPEQQAYVRGILEGRRTAISAPLAAMMPSPALGDLMQRTMAYARFAGEEGAASTPPHLNELAILMAARAWSSEYVWNAHARYAVRMGLPAEVVEAIRLRQEPAAMTRDVAAVYRLLDELANRRRVSDATFESARAVLGSDRALVDLVGTFGIYSMTAILTVVDESSLGENYVPQLTTP